MLASWLQIFLPYSLGTMLVVILKVRRRDFRSDFKVALRSSGDVLDAWLKDKRTLKSRLIRLTGGRV